MTDQPALRVDKWLWQARFFKSRSKAAQLCADGRLRIDGTRIDKAHALVRPGQVLTFPQSREVRVVRVVALGTRRGPAEEARTLYEDLSPPDRVPARTGPRPTKADRRAVERLRSERRAPCAGGAQRDNRKPMINRVLALFDKARSGVAGAESSVDELHLAAAALLVTAASADAHFDAAERTKIRELLGARFDLSEEEVETLLAAAVAESERSSQLLGFTRAIKDGYPYEDRVALIEMLWEVVYADGTADEFEMQLLRRIGGLVYVTDRDRGLARRRVLERLGRDDGD